MAGSISCSFRVVGINAVATAFVGLRSFSAMLVLRADFRMERFTQSFGKWKKDEAAQGVRRFPALIVL